MNKQRRRTALPSPPPTSPREATPAQRAAAKRMIAKLAFETFRCPDLLDTRDGLEKLLQAVAGVVEDDGA